MRRHGRCWIWPGEPGTPYQEAAKNGKHPALSGGVLACFNYRDGLFVSVVVVAVIIVVVVIVLMVALEIAKGDAHDLEEDVGVIHNAGEQG